MRIFHKYSGAGNTFYIFDDRKGDFPLSSISNLCRPEKGEWTDGVILWRPSRLGDAQMAYFNADGSIGEMCGNGLRCFVHFLHDQGIIQPTYSIEVFGKLLKVKGNPPTIWTYLGIAKVLFWEMSLLDQTLYVVDTGVPHTVIFAQDPVDVVKEGMALRYAEVFQPRGVNVNFVWVDAPDRLRVRTYERGVERETLACGTGAAASVFVASRLGKVGNRATVVTRSQETLEVELDNGISLSGPTEKIDEGQLKAF